MITKTSIALMALVVLAPIRVTIQISSDATQQAVDQKLHSQGIGEENNIWNHEGVISWVFLRSNDGFSPQKCMSTVTLITVQFGRLIC